MAGAREVLRHMFDVKLEDLEGAVDTKERVHLQKKSERIGSSPSARARPAKSRSILKSASQTTKDKNNVAGKHNKDLQISRNSAR